MLQDLVSRLKKPIMALGVRFDRSPISSVDTLSEFVQTRSSYIAQTSLYGYLKTRMGTQYRDRFQDDVFAKSMRMSAVRLFASCLADLTVFAVALTNERRQMEHGTAEAIACRCFDRALHRALDENDRTFISDDVCQAFAARAKSTIWPNAANADSAFEASCADLIRLAPVVDEFKKQDGEIVTNSIRFRWRDVREQLRKRLDADAVVGDWNQRDTARAE